MGLASALVGGGWQVATRHATTTSIAPEDLVILHYGVPALLLLPILIRLGGLRPPTLSWPKLLGLVAGAGLPFGIVAMTGARLAPVSHMGVLMAGASPLIAACAAWLLWGDSPGRVKGSGLALMSIGVVVLASGSVVGWTTNTWQGDVLFVCAAAMWACYTLTFRHSGSSPWHAAALVNAWSLLIVLLWVAARGGSALLSAPAADLVWQFLWQGVLAGVFGLWTFSVAIRHLGAASAAAFGALAPVVSAFGGWLFLGKGLSPGDVVPIVAVVSGVALASGAVGRLPGSPPGGGTGLAGSSDPKVG